MPGWGFLLIGVLMLPQCSRLVLFLGVWQRFCKQVDEQHEPNWTASPRVLFVKSFWQLLLGSALITLGIAAIMVGWFGASGTDKVWAQMPYLISGGLLGLALVFAGAALIFAFYLARLNLVTERRFRDLEHALLMRVPLMDCEDVVSSNGHVVASASGTKYHRPDCLLVVNKPKTRAMTAEQASRRTTPVASANRA